MGSITGMGNQFHEETSDLKNVIIIVAGIIFFILSVGGNGLVILAYTTNKKVRTLSNFYLASLAFVDFLIGLIIIPFIFLYHYNQQWVYGPTFCQIWLTLSYGLSCVGSAHLVLVAMDRYRILFHGISYLQGRTIWNMLEAVVLIWLLGIWTVSPIIVDWNNVAMDPAAKNHCMPKKTPSWVLMINTVVFLIPGFLMIRLYTEVFLKLRRKLREKAILSANPTPILSTSNSITPGIEKGIHEEKLTVPKSRIRINSDFSGKDLSIIDTVVKRKMVICYKKERKAALTLGMLIGAFLVFWSPWVIITFIQAFSPDTKIPTIFNASGALLGWTNSCVNPIVYAVRSKDFRNAFKKIFSLIRGSKREKIKCSI